MVGTTKKNHAEKRRGSPSCAITPQISPPWIFFVVPTIGFKLVYGFVIVRLHRRDLVWINVTTNPTAEWVARQITEAFSLGWGSALYDPRPGSHLWHHRHTPFGGKGHPGKANCTSLTLAEWLFRTADRIDPARVL